MDKPLEGCVAVVTGAARNIGRAIALALAGDGARLVVNARSSAKDAESVAAEIRERRRLKLRKRLARFDQIGMHRVGKSRHDAGSAQRVAHHGPTSRSVFRKRDGARRAEHGLPDDTRPHPDQLAENLADVGSRDEVARRPENPLSAIITERLVPEASRHVRLDRHRTIALDALLDQPPERRIAVRARIVAQADTFAGASGCRADQTM